MDLSQYFLTDGAVRIPYFLLILIILAFLVVVILLIGYVIILSRKVKSLEEVRYGFGGKPLFSIISILIILASIPITIYASRNTYNFLKSAEEEMKLNIDINKKMLSGDEYEVSFFATPSTNGVVWGEKTYDIHWEVVGPESFVKDEFKRDKTNVSYFTEVLPRGNYYVKVIAESEDFYIEQSQGLYLY